MRATDLYERITRHIISEVEAGAGSFSMPWHRWGESTGSPVNAITSRQYRGINVLLLWAAAKLNGYSQGQWATFRQWSEAGAQVRKGEKATPVLLWKPTPRDDDDDGTTGPRVVARTFNLFNADQVDGTVPLPSKCLSGAERIAAAETFFESCGAVVEYGGGRAFYAPGNDSICMPKLGQFRDAASFYSVLGHEHVHWTGAEHRLGRDLKGRFGSDIYAVEELIAELGSAFLCAHLGLSGEPRTDHASYLASWLRVLRSDARAILTASSRAQGAVDYLCALAGGGAGEARVLRKIQPEIARVAA